MNLKPLVIFFIALIFVVGIFWLIVVFPVIKENFEIWKLNRDRAKAIENVREIIAETEAGMTCYEINNETICEYNNKNFTLEEFEELKEYWLGE